MTANELVPIRCVKPGFYRITFRNGKTKRLKLTIKQAYKIINHLSFFNVIKIKLVK